MKDLIQGKDLNDLESTCQHLDLLKWGTWPLLGRPVFDILLMLDACIALAELPTFQEECSNLGLKVITGKSGGLNKD